MGDVDRGPHRVRAESAEPLGEFTTVKGKDVVTQHEAVLHPTADVLAHLTPSVYSNPINQLSTTFAVDSTRRASRMVK